MAFDSGSEPGEAGGGDSGNEAGEAGGGDSGNEGGTTTPGEAGADGGCTGGMRMLTVYNFDNSCTVSLNFYLNDAATSVAPSYEACTWVGSGAQIVVGPASTMYELGPNPFVSISGVELPGGDGAPPGTVVGDGGVGSTSTLQAGNSGGVGCVLVCCPFTDGAGCDSSQSGYTAFLQNCP